ncbi:MAG: hypothetical protein FWC36_05070 [Spirochaetes bacterium]|nr:hypothetical protein [Spirochaetota bacterium]
MYVYSVKALIITEFLSANNQFLQRLSVMKNKAKKTSGNKIINFLYKLSIIFLILLAIFILISVFIVDLFEYEIFWLILAFFSFLLGTPKYWQDYKKSKAEGRWNLPEFKSAIGFPIMAIGLLILIIYFLVS